MTKLYKLTTQDNYTRKGEYNQCLWGEGISHSGTGTGNLCGPGYIHAYTSPLLAVLLNPIHANLSSPKLWEAEGEVAKTDMGLKVGCVTLKLGIQIPLPTITIRQRVIFAILCARAVGFVNSVWDEWADAYINKTKSKYAAAYATTAAATAATTYATYAAATAATYAATAATYAATTYATYAATNAATAATYAARATNASHQTFNLISIAEQAIKMGAE